jgi:hypothetical protein
MNENRRKILEMLATGKITAEEADRLLVAMEKGPADPGAAIAPASGPRASRNSFACWWKKKAVKGP